MTDVLAVLDGLDLVVSLADGHLHPDDVAEARRNAQTVRDRSGYVGGTLVLALVGGTGSGKSSLINALVGTAAASVSPVRPHTQEPLALIPADADPGLEVLLDRLGIDRRIVQDRYGGIALLDMTDIDSVETVHREKVEALLPQVDGIIWVLDPVKYADPVLHGEFIAPLADSASQFVFVLNQIDRVDAEERTEIVADLLGLLRSDGIPNPGIFELAADPAGAPPIGVDALAAHLRDRLDAKRMQMGRVVAEAHRAARLVADAAGVRGGGSLEFEDGWAELLEATTTALAVAGPGRGVVDEALCALEDFVGRLAARAGGPFAARLRAGFPPERLEREVTEAIAVMERTVPRDAERSGRDRAVEPERRAAAAEVLAAELQHRIGRPLRTIVWERASLAATLTGMLADAAVAEAALGEPAAR